jgi:hypothetical protein
MNRLTSSIKKPWWKPYSRVRGEKVIQTREQTITHLLWFYLFSVSLAFLSAAIQIWGIPAKWGFSGAAKDILGPLSGAIAVKLSYDFIRDIISTEFDAATGKIESEVEARHLEKRQKALEQIDESIIKEKLDFKYLAYLKQVKGSERLQLQEVSSRLKERYSENRSAFEGELDEGFKEDKTIREVRCIIHSLPDRFLQRLAIKGIAEALHLELENACERTNPGNDLRSLRVDIYAYLSAWLICSIDNDRSVLMSIQPIGMRHTGRDNTPDREIYKSVIRAIGKIIAEGRYAEFEYYPDNDPLSSKFVKNTIINHLNQLIDLIEKYPLKTVKF